MHKLICDCNVGEGERGILKTTVEARLERFSFKTTQVKAIQK